MFKNKIGYIYVLTDHYTSDNLRFSFKMSASGVGPVSPPVAAESSMGRECSIMSTGCSSGTLLS